MFITVMELNKPFTIQMKFYLFQFIRLAFTLFFQEKLMRLVKEKAWGLILMYLYFLEQVMEGMKLFLKE
jgi:hypothetical protein